MSDIYRQHDKAFAAVSAYVIAKDGARVATIAFKFPRDGAGRLYAYVHWLGSPMVRGFAGGYGYDKRSAACASAVGRMAPALAREYDDGTPCFSEAQKVACVEFMRAMALDDGFAWHSNLQKAGFDVWQAV